ncbi:twin-arginine translocation signal domain-containing protein [Candidatus Woesearchaeota archaeon]|nr:twin-arginine translocation signal domain-containing protein [Candidatus Woesearchaeota archaeon]
MKMANKTGRREFLKALGAAGLTAAAGSVLGKSHNGNPSFNELWDLMIQYNTARNTRYTADGSTAFNAMQEQRRLWKEIKDMGRDYFPESHLNGITLDDYAQQVDFFLDQGKAYIKMNSYNDPGIDTIIIGDTYSPERLKELIGTDGNESFEWKGQKADYKVVAFEQEALSLDDVICEGDVGDNSYRAAFTFVNDTVFLNITKLRKEAKDMYHIGRIIEEADDGSLSSEMKLAKEVYSKLMDDIRQNPGYTPMSEQDKYKAFEDQFVKVMARSWINHERIHRFYREDNETWLYQASMDPRYNAMVFLAAGNEYQDFRNTLNKAGITMEDIADMSSEERAEKMGYVLENITN